MKIKDVWYFNCKQKNEDFLQPDFFAPISHIGLYCEIDELAYPLTVSVVGYCKGNPVLEKNIEISGGGQSEDVYISTAGKAALIKIAEKQDCYPDRIRVSCTSGGKHGELDKMCEYSVLSGEISDFDGNPFPSAVILYRYNFGDGPFCIGAWTDKKGFYAVKVPNGVYNAFYADDNSYGKGSLECWGWHIIVDRDETVNIKIGSGEVYSLNVFTDNGGFNNLFLSFRPMVYYKKDEYKISVGNIELNVTDIAPELEAEDISVTVNGEKCRVISAQRIYETADNGFAMPMYIVQTAKPANVDLSDKQTAILEYDTKDRLPQRAASLGFTQFYYKDSFALGLQ